MEEMVETIAEMRQEIWDERRLTRSDRSRDILADVSSSLIRVAFQLHTVIGIEERLAAESFGESLLTAADEKEGK